MIQFYTDTCRRTGELAAPEVAHKCFNDTFHPSPGVVDQLLNQLLRTVCLQGEASADDVA